MLSKRADTVARLEDSKNWDPMDKRFVGKCPDSSTVTNTEDQRRQRRRRRRRRRQRRRRRHRCRRRRRRRRTPAAADDTVFDFVALPTEWNRSSRNTNLVFQPFL